MLKLKLTIREYRRRFGIEQGPLAERLGVTQAALSMYERGKRRPGVEVLKKLSEIFGCNEEDILFVSKGGEIPCRHEGKKVCLDCGKVIEPKRKVVQ